MASKTNETIIELKSITKRYGLGDTESFALHNFDLTVKRGEFIMIMGPSGCGKTTLLNIIGLLDKATIGEYKLVGKSVDRISARKKAQFRANEIGFIFQSFNLIPNLTVIDNVTMPLVSNASSSASASITSLPNFPVASNSVSLSLAASSAILPSFSPTSQPATSTAAHRTSSWKSSKTFTPSAIPSSWSPTTPPSPLMPLALSTC